MKNKITYILLLLAVGYIIFLSECSSPLPPNTVTVTIRDTIPGDADTLKLYINVPEPYAVYNDSLRIDTLFRDVDSAEIIRRCMRIADAYYSVKKYNKILKDDSSAYAAIEFKLSENNIKDLNFSFQNRRPVAITNTTIHNYRRFKMFIGINAGGYLDKFGVGASIGILTPRDNLYTISNDFINKEIRFTMFKKIHFGRARKANR